VSHLFRPFGLFFLLLFIAGCPEESVTSFAPPQLLVNSPLHFGDSPKEVRQRGRLVITNGGDAQLSITDFKLEPDDGIFHVSLQELPLNINGRRSKDLILSFRPKEEKSYRAELSFASNHEGDALDPVVLIGEGTSNILCLPCTPAPEPECHFDGESSLVYVPATSTNCESSNNQCSYIVIEIPCGNAPCDELTGLCPDTEIPTFDAGPPAPASVCGDGELEGDEECDDGNTDDGDGCSATCTVEDGWDCTVEPCEEICGDGETVGDEECDDGNTDDGDGCSATCTVEDGWDCTEEPCEEICGDGEIVGEETCDDGNTTTETECSYGTPTCTRCNATCSEILNLTGRLCGDGVNDPEEICDDGNTVTETECPYGTPACAHCNATCSEILSLAGSTCGDGVNDPEEFCDDGLFSATCDTDCTLAECGDGLTNPAANEDCDDSGVSASCDADCSSAICGDGTLNALANEFCDDANTTPGDGCSDTCTVEDGWVCTGEGCETICGDDIVAGDEQCDNSGDPKCADCTCPTGYSLNTLDGLCNYCGDNRQTDVEGCDDANTAPGDGCSATCTVEDGWDCTGEGCETICGDGNIIAGEETCDDDGTYAFGTELICDYGETCQFCHSETCTIENGATSGECGDGDINGDEECDNGANDGSYGTCNPDCTNAPQCGDNTIDSAYGETCDGTANGIPNCREDCSFCGDNIPDSSEQCDDGNNSEDDSCTNDCLNISCGDNQITGNENCEMASSIADGVPFVSDYECPHEASGPNQCLYCDSDTCKTTAASGPYCGDTEVNGPEGCDNDGTYTWALSLTCDYGDTACSYCKSDSCTISSGSFVGACGNNIIENGSDGSGTSFNEECDNSDDAQCTQCACPDVPLDYTRNSDTDLCHFCGDGLISDTEKCDTDGDDNCSYCTACGVDLLGDEYPMNASVCGFCGDGVTNGGEECDDGEGSNTGLYSGCNSDCSLAGFCGDDLIDDAEGETCDGTAAGITDCRNDCSYCGDGEIDAEHGEECDDGNDDDTDGCYTNCTIIKGDHCGDGESNEDIVFDGSDFLVMNSDSGLTWSAPFTIEGWIYPTAGSRGIWAGGDLSNGFGLHLEGSNAIEVEKCASTCQSETSESVASLLNRWSYFALVATGSSSTSVSLKLYLEDHANEPSILTVSPSSGDGYMNPIFTQSVSIDENDVTEARLALGRKRDNSSKSFQGSMDNIRYWGRALSSEEIAESFVGSLPLTDPVTGNTAAGLEASYTMEASGNLILNDVEADDLYDNTHITLPSHVTSGNAEICDDGNNITETECEYNTQSCVHCNADCTEVLNLEGPYCGDNTVDDTHGEVCDDGNAETETECSNYGDITCVVCSEDCLTEITLDGQYCGDGIPQPANGEACDDGDNDDSNGCSNACTVNVTDVCGDGYLDYTLDLDGYTDYVQLPSNQGLGWTSSFTIEGWIFPERSTGTSGIWSYGDTNGGFSLSTTNSNKQLRVDYCYPDNATTTCIYFHSDELNESPTDTWVYFAATLDPAENPDRYYLRLYWDDTLNPDLLETGESPTGTELWASDGTDEHPADGYQNANFSHVFDSDPTLGEGWTGVYAWNGMMDNIRIWSHALSPLELFAAKTGSLANTTGLLAEYGMSDTGFVMVNDLGDSNKDGLLMGDATWSTVEACDDGNTTDGDGCSSTCTVEDGWNCSGAPSSCGFATLTEGGESCVDAPPLLYVPGSTIFTAPQYQVTADYGYTDNYAGYKSSLSGCMSEEGNIAPQEGEEVVFKITLPRAHKLYAELQTGNDISGTLYIFENCEGSFSEPDHIKCVDEHNYVTENNGSYEEIEYAHYNEGSRTFYLGVDAWCMESWNPSSCPINASKDFTLIYYVVDYSN